MSELSLEIKQQAEYWASASVFDKGTQAEIKNLLESQNEEALQDRFYRSLRFGTGGMRGVMGAGTAFINSYNIQKASVAIANYLHSLKLENRKITLAIAYDSRTNSALYAKKAACVFAAYGVHSLLLEQMRPVPMLSFMIREFKCQAGLCITASHNPPEYNGFKVYWSCGAQLVPPHDKNIAKLYDEISSYEELKEMDFNEALEKKLIETNLCEKLDKLYLAKLKTLSLNPVEHSSLKISYSPLHGTGYYVVPKALKDFGFSQVFMPESQKKPNGLFPTVSSPNPEDTKALYEALKLAADKKCELVMGTDPDTDRLGVFSLHQGDYHKINGNQLASLLCYYILSTKKEKNLLSKSQLLIKTIVTTDLIKKIAEYFGVELEETLTGFKWIAERIEDYESGKRLPYREFVCGGEESYGFLAGTFVRDKDAVMTACLTAEMASFYQQKEMTLIDLLDEIYMKFGLFTEELISLSFPGKKGSEKISAIMERFRQNPQKEFCSQKVLQWTDYLLDEDSGRCKAADKKRQLPKENVLSCELEDHTKIFLRPSGTEPKIKIYLLVLSETRAETKKELFEQKASLDKKMKAYKKMLLAKLETA